jgi:hypothetical protein
MEPLRLAADWYIAAELPAGLQHPPSALHAILRANTESQQRHAPRLAPDIRKFRWVGRNLQRIPDTEALPDSANTSASLQLKSMRAPLIPRAGKVFGERLFRVS